MRVIKEAIGIAACVTWLLGAFIVVGIYWKPILMVLVAIDGFVIVGALVAALVVVVLGAVTSVFARKPERIPPARVISR